MNSLPARQQATPTLSLVLGSGGARGLAHIGVIETLERRGFRINAIAGSSMGALVGGVHAAGKLPAYREWVTGLSATDVFSLLDWTFTGGGLIRGRKIIATLKNLIGEIAIEHLPLAFTAVAVDLDQGREVWLSDGPLFDAIRASIAIPGVFTPHRYRGRTLVDGGLLNPVPVAPTLRTLSDYTVVVDVNGPDSEPPPLAPPPAAEAHHGNAFTAKLKEYLDSFSKDRSPVETTPGLLAVLSRSFDTMQETIARQQLVIFRPDLIITLPKNTCLVYEFHRAASLIDLGRRYTEAALAAHPVMASQPAAARRSA